MNVRDGVERKVSFNTRDELGDKIDKLTVVMSRLAAKDSHGKRPFKTQNTRVEVRMRSYNQGSYQNRSNSRTGDNLQIVDPDRAIEIANVKETLEDM